MKVFLLLLLLPGFAFGGAHDVPTDSIYDNPPLLPGGKNPLKKWEIEPIAKDVYAFRYTFYRTLFIVTDEGVIVTDPMNATSAAVMRREISRITDQPVRFVAYSHSHWDHVSGGQIFKDEGAQFVAQEQCARNLAESSSDQIVPPDITFDESYRIALGGKSLTMHYYGPSHDNCLVVMHIEPANLLFMVDTANPPDGWAMFYNPAVSEDRVWHMVRFFNRVQALVTEKNIQTVIGAHMAGGVDPATGGFAIIPGLKGPATVIRERGEFWAAIIDVVNKELAAGTAPADVPKVIVDRGVLADRISGYDAAKMLLLMRRITHYAMTGE